MTHIIEFDVARFDLDKQAMVTEHCKLLPIESHRDADSTLKNLDQNDRVTNLTDNGERYRRVEKSQSLGMSQAGQKSKAISSKK